jgi:hypothetical protein
LTLASSLLSRLHRFLSVAKAAAKWAIERREGFDDLTWNLSWTVTESHEPEAKKAESECSSANFHVSSVKGQDDGKNSASPAAGEIQGDAANCNREEKDAGIKASATFENASSAADSVHSASSVVKSNSPAAKTPASEGGRYTSDGKSRLEAGATTAVRAADLNHFFPVDPTLPAHLRDPKRVAAPPPSDAELDRRNRQFDRVHGFVRRGKQSYPTRESPDWKILNGR